MFTILVRHEKLPMIFFILIACNYSHILPIPKFVPCQYSFIESETAGEAFGILRSSHCKYLRNVNIYKRMYD